jgi:glutamate-5-semialdehyde dehydrogenase
MKVDMDDLGRRAKAASRRLVRTTSDQRATAVRAVAEALRVDSAVILEANRLDCEAAASRGMSDSLLDRLKLDSARLERLIEDTEAVAELADPTGNTIDAHTLANGLALSRIRVPLGVIGVIYEARPNVTVDIAALCLRTGNAAILRGGSETLRSNQALVSSIQRGLSLAGMDPDAVQAIDSTDRKYVRELLRLERFVDMIIPRGGAGLHRLCREEGTIPVITGGIGICHAFVDETADLESALDIVENAKVQRPSVCNALDTVLVHRAVASEFVPRLVERLVPLGVTLHPDPAAQEAAGSRAGVVLAGPEDFDKEWLSLDLGVRIVDGLEEAIDHIEAHGSRHSDTILTNDGANADRFVLGVDSAAVYVNASTRFTDGGEFGLGAEVAVSTQKLHARGPMGLEALTTYKWVGRGSGQVRK